MDKYHLFGLALLSTPINHHPIEKTSSKDHIFNTNKAIIRYSTSQIPTLREITAKMDVQSLLTRVPWIFTSPGEMHDLATYWPALLSPLPTMLQGTHPFWPLLSDLVLFVTMLTSVYFFAALLLFQLFPTTAAERLWDLRFLRLTCAPNFDRNDFTELRLARAWLKRFNSGLAWFLFMGYWGTPIGFGAMVLLRVDFWLNTICCFIARL